MSGNVFVEVSIRGVKDGAVWARTKVELPGQSQASYNVIEDKLGATLTALGGLVVDTGVRAPGK